MPLSWVEIHGALTHIPIAFLLTAPLFEIGAVLFRKPEWRIVSFWLLVVAVVMSVPALASGWITGDNLKFTSTSTPAPPLFVQHRLVAFITAGLAAVLLLWRVKARDRLPDKARIAAIILALLAAGAAGYTGYLGGQMVFGEGAESSSATATKYRPLRPKTQLTAIDPQLAATGKKLFKKYQCRGCHEMDGRGGDVGPDLTHAGRRHADLNWQIEHLKNPKKLVPDSTMPPFNNLPSEDLKALAAYMVTRK